MSNYHPEVQADNPGGNRAVANGCTCPAGDNHFGDGYRGHGRFIICATCPLHSDEAVRRLRDAER